MDEVKDTPTPVYNAPEPKKQKSSTLKVVLFSLLFLVLGAAGGYYYANSQAQAELDQKAEELAKVEAEKAKLTNELADAKKASEKSTTVVSKEVSQEQLDNIIDSVGSGNYSALKSYLADPVKVVIAASEFGKDRTPTEAIADLKYLDSATDPWNFDLPATELTEYKNGDYKQYFPTKALVGKSKDGKVVVFGFNSDAKINLIFMASSADIL